MRVFSMMTREPITVTGDVSLDDAQHIMDENRVRHLPVLDDDKLSGILSDRDLLEATGWLPARVHACRGPVASDGIPKYVREVMTRQVVEVSPEDLATDVLSKCLEHGVGCLPVISAGKLVGIVTEMDLLDAYVLACAQRVLSDGTGPGVGDFMSEAPETVPWGAPIGTAIEMCKEKGIRHLPVVDESFQLGLVSDRDLRRAVGAGHESDTPVDKVVTRRVVTIPSDAPMARAAMIMSERRISCLPVVDGENLTGILTVKDILEYHLGMERGESAQADGADPGKAGS